MQVMMGWHQSLIHFRFNAITIPISCVYLASTESSWAMVGGKSSYLMASSWTVMAKSTSVLHVKIYWKSLYILYIINMLSLKHHGLVEENYPPVVMHLHIYLLYKTTQVLWFSAVVNSSIIAFVHLPVCQSSCPLNGCLFIEESSSYPK